MKYPSYLEYEKIYKRYLSKGVNYLIELTDIKKDDKVLDLCGGNGRLTKELLKYSNDVSYLDKEEDMIPIELMDLGINVYNEDIKEFIKHHNKKYDKVFCMQAVNYYLNDIDIEKFSELFNKEGEFIFNTFKNKPSNKPLVKEYTIDDDNYLEVSYLVNDEVYHIQIKEGHLPHFTKFNYISKEKYVELLSPYFDLNIIETEKTSVYICKKK